MQPLNGLRPMTREERNERRRVLDRDPYHHALSLLTAKAWRDRNKDLLKAKRRAKYVERREEICRQAKAWRDRNKEKVRAAQKKWADKNREYLIERERIRSSRPEEKVRRRLMMAKRAERMRSDPDYAEHIREQKRRAYHRNKNRRSGIRWLIKTILIPKWEKVEREGREEAYLKRCSERTRIWYQLWKKDRFDIFKTLMGETT